VVLLDEEAEDREVLVLAVDGWTRVRMLRQLIQFERVVAKLEQASLTMPIRQMCVEARALAITLQKWLREAVPPAGFVEVGESEEK